MRPQRDTKIETRVYVHAICSGDPIDKAVRLKKKSNKV